SSCMDSPGRVGCEAEWRGASRIEDSCIVCELCERALPDPARLHLLCSRVGQRALRREKVEHGTDSRAVATERDLLGLLGASEQIGGRSYPARGGLQRVVRAVHLEDDLLLERVVPGSGGFGLCLRLHLIVRTGEAGEDRDAEAEVERVAVPSARQRAQ